jgi:ferrochelatase
MPRYALEPAPKHGATRRTAVLLVNLGTPEAPTESALRRYLGEFLWDPRIVEIPRLDLVADPEPFRTQPASCKIGSQIRQDLDAGRFAAQGAHRASGQAAQGLARPGGQSRTSPLAWAMRYGQPSIASVSSTGSSADGAERVLVVPALSAVRGQFLGQRDGRHCRLDQAQRATRWRFRFIKHFHDEPGYIASVGRHREGILGRFKGRPDKLLMSFHGLPRRSLDLGDPYYCECQKTGRLIAESSRAHGQDRVS